MIKEQSRKFKVVLMCRLLNVSVSGYYAWLNRAPSLRDEANMKLTRKIKIIVDDEKSRAGAPRIARRLKAEGELVSRHRVARIMKLNGWRARAAKKFKASTNSNHRLPVAPNLLNQDFSAKKTNGKWVSDITYVWTDEGWLYLAVIIDLYSRAVIGWSMSTRMTADLVKSSMQMALALRQPNQGVLFHSDRSSQYTSNSCQT